MGPGVGTQNEQIQRQYVEVSLPAQTTMLQRLVEGFLFSYLHWEAPKYFESYKEDLFLVSRFEWNNLLHGGGHIAGGAAV